jgi:hypothetical protein
MALLLDSIEYHAIRNHVGSHWQNQWSTISWNGLKYYYNYKYK